MTTNVSSATEEDQEAEFARAVQECLSTHAPKASAIFFPEHDSPTLALIEKDRQCAYIMFRKDPHDAWSVGMLITRGACARVCEDADQTIYVLEGTLRVTQWSESSHVSEASASRGGSCIKIRKGTLHRLECEKGGIVQATLISEPAFDPTDFIRHPDPRYSVLPQKK